MVMEYLEGELFDYIVKRGRVSVFAGWPAFRSATAVACLACLAVSHSDLVLRRTRMHTDDHSSFHYHFARTLNSRCQRTRRGASSSR